MWRSPLHIPGPALKEPKQHQHKGDFKEWGVQNRMKTLIKVELLALALLCAANASGDAP
jgi:hypothetical protein